MTAVLLGFLSKTAKITGALPNSCFNKENSYLKTPLFSHALFGRPTSGLNWIEVIVVLGTIYAGRLGTKGIKSRRTVFAGALIYFWHGTGYGNNSDVFQEILQ